MQGRRGRHTRPLSSPISRSSTPEVDDPSYGTAPPVMPDPVNILTHKDRQRARLDGAIQRAWANPAYREDIRKLQRLVDVGQMTELEALERLADLDQPDPVRLHVVTIPRQPDPVPYDDTYTCRCPQCRQDRAQRLRAA